MKITPIKRSYNLDLVTGREFNRRSFLKNSALATLACVIGQAIPVSTADNSDEKIVNAGEWTRLSDMPTPRFMLAAGVIDDILYAVGGNRSYSDNSPTELPTLESYDMKTKKWIKLADMPTPRAQLGAGVVNGKLYAIGGQGVRGKIGEKYEFQLPTLEVYDPKTDKWSKLKDMPDGVHGPGVIGIGDKLHVIGGYYTTCWQVYDTKSEEWSDYSLSSPVHTSEFSHHSLVYYENRILHIGGEVGAMGDAHRIRDIISWNPNEEGKIRRGQRAIELPQPGFGLGAGIMKNKLFIVGGYGFPSNSNKLRVYDFEKKEWQRLSDIPTPRDFFGYGVVNNNLYVVGGRTDKPFGPSAVLEVFTPKKDK